MAQASLKSLLQQRFQGSGPRVFDSVCQRKGWRTCNYNKFPSDAEAAGLGTKLPVAEEMALRSPLDVRKGGKVEIPASDFPPSALNKAVWFYLPLCQRLFILN